MNQLNLPTNKSARKCKDHQGNTFPSIRAMCAYWHIDTQTYQNRKKKGMSIEEILTLPVQRRKSKW